MKLPAGDRGLLVRTSFSDDEAWKRVVVAASSENAERFTAVLQIVDDRSFEGADPTLLAEGVGQSTGHSLLVIADEKTMTSSEILLLCVDLVSPSGQFRVVPNQLWSVENNIALANMDFDEFLNAVDSDSVFRGFPD